MAIARNSAKVARNAASRHASAALASTHDIYDYGMPGLVIPVTDHPTTAGAE
jgi:hypothetical protein